MSQAEEFGADSKPRLSKKQLESLNIMKMSYYHRNNDSAYVEVDNRGYKPFMSRPVQGLLNKGIISIPRTDNPRFWGDIGSTGAYIVYLNPVAWEYSFTYPFSTGNRNVRQEGTEMVLDAEQKGDIWDYLVVEEQPEPRKKVRTMTGKPHTPRKLVKDQAIQPEEAAKRVKLEAETAGFDMYYTRDEAIARARELGCHDVHTHEMEGRTIYMPCYSHERYQLMRYNEMERDIYGAENKKDETVVDKTEESGITTETRQYKKKKYNPDKMKTDIPADVLNQTDSDDFWVAICAGILGIGIGASIERIYGSYRR